MTIAEISVQKKSALPCPKGCNLLRLRLDIRSPISNKPEATRSVAPSRDSASITTLPVKIITTTFIAISHRSTKKEVVTAFAEETRFISYKMCLKLKKLQLIRSDFNSVLCNIMQES